MFCRDKSSRQKSPLLLVTNIDSTPDKSAYGNLRHLARSIVDGPQNQARAHHVLLVVGLLYATPSDFRNGITVPRKATAR